MAAVQPLRSRSAGPSHPQAPSARVTHRVSPAPRSRSIEGSRSVEVPHLLTTSSERQELLCSVIGLGVKLGVTLLAAVSLINLAGAYQQRLDRHGELSAILDIEKAKLRKAQDRFDQLFATDGEQRLIREQDQWIAPDRLRVVWAQPAAPERPNPIGTPAPAVASAR